MEFRVDRIDPAEGLLACCALPRIDHVDVHLLRTEPARGQTPEQWAREILEGPPAAMRARLCAGWTMLGIKLRHRELRAVAGWPITHSDSSYIRLQGDSRVQLTGQLVTRRTAQGVEFATFTQFGNAAARLLWNRVLPAHLRTVESLLRDAARRTG